jgi:hypothetical protein
MKLYCNALKQSELLLPQDQTERTKNTRYYQIYIVYNHRIYRVYSKNINNQ